MLFQEKKINNLNDKNKYQKFLEELTRNSLLTSKDTTPFSIPSHPNYEISEEKRKPIMKSQNLKNKIEQEEKKQNMEVFNFNDKNSNAQDQQNVIHQLNPNEQNSNIQEQESQLQMAPFTFKEAPQPKILMQTPKGLYKNVNPFIISSARLPETQKILNSFRNDQSLDASNILEPKNSAASNKANTTCLICFDKLPDAVFMECGHGGIFLIIIIVY